MLHVARTVEFPDAGIVENAAEKESYETHYARKRRAQGTDAHGDR
jgi:hypothetical protein